LTALSGTLFFADLKLTQSAGVNSSSPVLQDDQRNGFFYNADISSTGWQPWVSDGESAGDPLGDETLRQFQIQAQFDEFDASVEYSAYCSERGWQETRSNGQTAGWEGKGNAISAIKINVNTKTSEHLTLYYRVHFFNGADWEPWVNAGEAAGDLSGKNVLDAYELRIRNNRAESKDTLKLLDSKGVQSNDAEDNTGSSISYYTTIPTVGQDNTRMNGLMSGTIDRGLPISDLNIKLDPNTQFSESSGVKYRAFMNDIKTWTPWSVNGSGLQKEKSRALSAVQILLSGPIVQKYDVFYRVHANNSKWGGWHFNGTFAGTLTDSTDYIDAIEIFLRVKLPETVTKIGFVGDSLTRGAMCYSTYRCVNAPDTALKILGPGFSLENYGVGGSVAGDLAKDDFVFNDLKEKNIKVVHMMMGTNNALSSNYGNFLQEMQSVVARLEQSGIEYIILSKPIYVKGKYGAEDDTAQTNSFITGQIDSAIDKIIEQDPFVFPGDFDGFNIFKDNANLFFYSDGVHLSTKGYAALGELWANAFNRIMR
jgi:uncharacterized protein YjdB/lysophospholipase L1-like esterase